MAYNPQPETAAMLDRSWKIVETTPYKVTARYVFYQLLGEGWYTPKDSEEKQRAYKDSFLKALSKARHEGYKLWRPDTLEDDTRQAVIRGQGFDSVEDWLSALSGRLTCSLDLWHDQPHYIELWCEHRGMVSQFNYYTSGITIRPMGGQASIYYKYQAAQALDEAAQTYGKRPLVLYFGDLDKGGKTIAATLRRDIGKWCGAYFDFEWCGISQEHVTRYNLPDSPEKPGQFQWEALGDANAGQVITETVSKFVRPDAMEEVRKEAQRATVWIRDKLSAVADEWQAL